MLVGTGTRKIDLPHEAGEWIEVRDLTRKQIAEARRLKLKSLKSMLEDLGDIREQIKEYAGPPPEPNAALTLDAYDIDYVLAEGIVAWSYGEKFSAEAVDRLDQKTAEYVARDLLGIEEEEQGKDAG